MESVDFDAHAPGRPYPTGRVIGTQDPDEAMRFVTASDAMDLVRTASSEVPTRPDGKPNRPLSAFAVCVEPFPVGEDGDQ